MWLLTRIFVVLKAGVTWPEECIHSLIYNTLIMYTGGFYKATFKAAQAYMRTLPQCNMPAENIMHVNPAHMLRNLIPGAMHDKFGPSDFPGREHQLNQAGSISIGGLPKWCGCHRTSVMGLKITPADPEALMWPRTLWCVWFYVSPMKPIKLQMQTQPDPSSKLFRRADTVC